MLALVFTTVAAMLSADPTPLFNGKNLDGWREASKDKASLTGKTEAFGGRFKVKDGVIAIDPSVKGDLHIETEKAIEGDTRVVLEVKPGPKCNNDLFIRGTKFDLTLGSKEGKNLKDGEWATVEIVIKGDAIEHKINGETARSSKTKGGPTPLRVRAEFGALEIKSVKLAP